MPEAQYYLGIIHGLDPLKRNDAEAIACLERSAKAGYPDAIYRLASRLILIRGELISKDEQRGVEMLRPLEYHGDALALLSWCYASGIGVPVDHEQAFSYLQKASNCGHSESMCSLADRYSFGFEGVEKDLTKAVELYAEAASKGSVEAQTQMGWIYFEGLGQPVNKELAAYYWQFAANRGDAVAQNNLAYLYEKGEGVRQDDRLCFDWLKKSAEQGFVDAQNELGELLMEGRGTEKNLALARGWFEKAAAQNCDDAIKNLERFFGTNSAPVQE